MLTIPTPAMIEILGPALDAVPVNPSPLIAPGPELVALAAAGQIPNHPDRQPECTALLQPERLEEVFTRVDVAGMGWQAQRDAFAAELPALCRRESREREAARLGQQRQVLSFSTAPRLEQEGRELIVRLRQLRLGRALAAADAGEVLEAVERPQTRFADVIGADAARRNCSFSSMFYRLHSAMQRSV